LKPSRIATVAQLAEFDEIIDVRSPAEFAVDHVPGAINLPVLNNEERARIGTLYKEVSPFDAKKLGAALVSRNISLHLEAHFLGKPRSYCPLVYCWRGGNRSGSLTHVLQEIGFATARLEGGYRGYRHKVMEELETLPEQFQFRVIRGPTGSGKSRLLRALSQIGAQVLDLEALAAHRGSVLGQIPNQPQPTQKSFESALWDQLRNLSPGTLVFVESESKKIGDLQVPADLMLAMRNSPCVNLEVSREARIKLLIEDYQHFLNQPDQLVRQLGLLIDLRGRETVETWKALIERGDWTGLVGALLEQHYDPAYLKSLSRNYGNDNRATVLQLGDISPADFKRAATLVLHLRTQLPTPQ
jgi:tRNA 2-selenouridine synthase